MQSLVLFLLLSTPVFSAILPARRDIEQGGKWKRQFSSALVGFAFGSYGKVPDPPGAAPRRQILNTTSTIPGVKRVKIRSGPYKVPNMGKKSYSGHAGMLENYPDWTIEKPCMGACTIVRQQAGLEYADGKVANIDTDMWLHHMVSFAVGPTRWDAGGYGQRCTPHWYMWTSPAQSERYFTSGNERTVFDFNPDNSGSGFHLTAQDQIYYAVELMNMAMEDKVVYLTMTYDLFEGPLPNGWNEIKTVWLDVNQCGNSEVVPPRNEKSYTIESKPWKPNFEGTVVSLMSHLHDGGIHIDVVTGPNTTLCTSKANYAESAEYIFNGKEMGGEKPAKDHISSMSGCSPKDVQMEMTKDQAWQLKGHFDYSKREGNLEGGEQAEVMTLGIVLVSVPPGPISRPKTK